jgi:hypothetical protein
MHPRARRRILVVASLASLGIATLAPFPTAGAVLAGPSIMGIAPALQEAAPTAATAPAKGVSGQGALRFRVLATSAVLPEEARRVLISAHGGFAVDHRDGRGETYFFLPGAGILRLSADFKQVALVPTAPEMKDLNQHNTKIWYASDGTAYLSFPANDKGRVFTTSLTGELVHTLGRPAEDDDLGLPAVRDYFAGGGAFAPTDVEYLDGLLYVTTGYSPLDAVLTARVTNARPLRLVWHDLAFSGRGTGPGQLGTGHGLTVPRGTKRIDVADRANAEIERFTRHGQYLSTLNLPVGSMPCDIDYLGRYAVVPALDGPDKSRGAPIYILEDDRLASTVWPQEDLGLSTFKHIHNAVLRQVGGRLYVIAQTWNPGDFAVLEQVTP